MKKLLLILMLSLTFFMSQSQIVADHNAVREFDSIPANWIDSVKCMLVEMSGESHASTYNYGQNLLEALNPTYQTAYWGTTPPAYRSDALRLGTTGNTGEADYFTNEAGKTAYKNRIANQNNTGNEFDVMGFVWCWDMYYWPAPSGTRDPRYNFRWGGTVVGSPDGDNVGWGLDAADSVLVGNRVTMSDYLDAVQEFQQFCIDNGWKTKIIYTTGPVDDTYPNSDGTEDAFQREAKHDYIRNHVYRDPNAILFDYADILCWNNDNEFVLGEWDDNGTIRRHNKMHPDNTNDYDESWNEIAFSEDGDHIGEVGSLRITKALWWMLARIAGWKGVDKSPTPSSNKYYVATDGSDSNDGSINNPFATFQKAVNVAYPGDTVFFRGGHYYSYYSTEINPEKYGGAVGRTGTEENPIVYMGYPGEWPVFDCINHCDSIPDNPFGGEYNTFINVSYAEHIVFKDFEVSNVLQCDSTIDGAFSCYTSCNLTFDNIVLHDVGQRGYWMQGGTWLRHTVPYLGYGDPEHPSPEPYWGYGHPDTTRWINCDTYNLCDSLVSNIGNAADGYKTLYYEPSVNIWDGCRTWNFSDDGWDPSSLTGAVRYFTNCWSSAGDKYKNTDNGDTERNAFKFTGVLDNIPEVDTTKVTLYMDHCIAYNSNYGFYEIGGYYPTNGYYYNNTSFRNGINWAGPVYDGQGELRSNHYRNNIAFGSTSLNAISQPYDLSFIGNDYDVDYCTWVWRSNYPNYETNNNYTVSFEMFNDTTHANILAEFTAPRKPDGSLPDITTLALNPTSDLIDGGIDVGISYTGLAPDLGAFEYSPDTPTSNPTNMPELIAAVLAAVPGDNIELDGPLFTGPLNVNVDGELNSRITIEDTDGDNPVFDGTITISGDYITFNNVGISGGFTMNRPISAEVINCTFTGTGNKFYTLFPLSDWKGKDWNINNNNYIGISPSATFNGYNWSIWQKIYKYDRNSTFK